MTNLIVPRHAMEQRIKARQRDPTFDMAERHDYRGSLLTDGEKWAEEWKTQIMQRMTTLFDQCRPLLNRVVVAIFQRPESIRLGGGVELIDPTKNSEEDIYRGSAGLVIAMGPRCFEDSEKLTWTEADKFKVGDWVLFNRMGLDKRMHINGVECFCFHDERSIMMVVPRPDLVY